MLARLQKQVSARLKPLLPDIAKIALTHRRVHGRWPRLIRPRTFNEKIQWRKLHDRDPRLVERMDKIAVKAIVSRKLGPEWVIPTLWSGPNPEDIPFATLPPPYVVKANHASACNYFVLRESDAVPERIIATARMWLATDYSQFLQEWPYALIKPQILVEPMLQVDGQPPSDLRFLVFNGHVHFIRVTSGTGAEREANYFDTNWVVQPFTHGSYRSFSPSFPRPRNLAELIRAAEVLAEDFSFVRVDFYNPPEGPKFGELTFFPLAGLHRFYPPEADRMLGDLWQLPSRARWMR